MLLTVLSSCKKDDENSVVNADLVGTWAEEPSVEQFTFVFESNGQGSFQIKNCNTNIVEEVVSFTYVFNSKTSEILFSGFYSFSNSYIKFLSTTTIQFYRDVSFTDSWSKEMYKQ